MSKAFSRSTKTQLSSKKMRTASSRRWLLRQLNDPYVQAAQHEGYRSRAAFKLLEIHEKYQIFKSGQTVIDLGAAPGGWTQVVAPLVKANDTHPIIAIDLLPMDPLPGVLCSAQRYGYQLFHFFRMTICIKRSSEHNGTTTCNSLNE